MSQLKNYLIEHNSTFPLYNNPGSRYDTVYPSQQPYFCGMYLGSINNNYSISKDTNL